MNSPDSDAHNGSRLTQLADRLDCLTETDVLLLTDAAPSTVEDWRKRGNGPAYSLVGNRVLYPRQAVAEWIASRLRARNTAPAGGAL